MASADMSAGGYHPIEKPPPASIESPYPDKLKIHLTNN